MTKKEFDLAGHEFIELNKLLKLLKLVGSGGEANSRIENGAIETRKRNKLRHGDVVIFQANSIMVRS